MRFFPITPAAHLNDGSFSNHPKNRQRSVQQEPFLLALNTEPFELRLSGFRPRLSGFRARLSRFRFRIRPGKELIDALFEASHVLLVRTFESSRFHKQVEELIPIMDVREFGVGKQQFGPAIGQPEEVEQRNQLQQSLGGSAIVPAGLVMRMGQVTEVKSIAPQCLPSEGLSGDVVLEQSRQRCARIPVSIEIVQ